jgi:glutamate-ammonia-ligase adenylyltransferase
MVPTPISLNQTGIMETDIALLFKEAYLIYRADVHQLNLQEKPARVPESEFRDLREKVEKIWDDVMGIE